MERIETVLKELVTQVSRLAFALETIAKVGYGAGSHFQPCRCCGSTLTAPGLSLTTCPVCTTENTR